MSKSVQPDPRRTPVPAHATPDEPTLAERTITAAQWRFSASVLQAGLRFGVGILLARLLAPDDFGLVAFTFVIIGIAGLVTDFGFGPAIIQRRSLTDRHIRVSFTASILLGVGAAAALFFVAPVCGWILHSPLLPRVLRVQALSFVLVGFGATAHYVLRRALDFRTLFFIGLVGYSVGYALIAVTMALLGFGVWSLVCGALMQALVANVLALAVVRHPVRPLIAAPELRELLEFGVGANLNMIANYTAINGDNFIVGQQLGTAALGLYARAYNLMKLPMEYFDGVMWAVLFPAFSEIADDPPRLGRAYLTGVQATALVAGPAMAGMIVAAPHVIAGLYGDKWIGATVPFQILCVVGFFRSFDNVAGALTHASGRVYREVLRQSIYAGLVVGGSILGSANGISGVALGVAGAILYMYFAMAHLSLKIIGRGWSAFFAAQLPGLLLALAVAPVALVIRLALEQSGVGSTWILFAIVGGSAATVALATYWLPARVRPVPLFVKLESAADHLPAPARLMVLGILRGRGIHEHDVYAYARTADFHAADDASTPTR